MPQTTRQQAVIRLIQAHHSPRCQHVKVNGVRCGSPAMKRNALCYFHHHQLAKQQEDDLSIPLLEDANSVQLAISKVVRAILAGKLDPRTAGLALYGLQTAAINLPNTDFEPTGREPVISDDLEVPSDSDCNDPDCPESRAHTPSEMTANEERWMKELLDRLNERHPDDRRPNEPDGDGHAARSASTR